MSNAESLYSRITRHRCFGIGLRRAVPIAVLLAFSTIVQGDPVNIEPVASDPDQPAPTDYLSFAQGAIPVSIKTFGAKKTAGLSEAMQVIDGSAGGFTVVSGVEPQGGVEIVFALPASTRFEEFAVPSVLETPSPSQTFIRQIDIDGSAAGPDGPWQPLAGTQLSRHPRRAMLTPIPADAVVPVRWVKVRLSGGLELGGRLMFYEFSELQGHGQQERVALADHFNGIWKGRGVLTELQQEGATVSGCVDRDGEPFAGTVSGNILRGRSVDPRSGIVSLFVLIVTGDDELQGVRSTNGAPFHLQIGAPAAPGTTTRCSTASATITGCESVLHGINFAFDSAVIQPESRQLMQQLQEGLQTTAQATIVIEGHTSSEGSEAYNLGLSQRRAQAVVDDLVVRGIDAGQISAVGRGESMPIADNDTESGRVLNRRVEVHCGGS